MSWIFDKIGFDTLHIRRVTVDMNYDLSSPLAKSIEAGVPLEVSDQEWARIAEEVLSYNDPTLEIIVDDQCTRVQTNKPPVSVIRIGRHKR